jgi:hypothetical protein
MLDEKEFAAHVGLTRSLTEIAISLGNNWSVFLFNLTSSYMASEYSRIIGCHFLPENSGKLLLPLSSQVHSEQ